jgi:hypothetical protein
MVVKSLSCVKLLFSIFVTTQYYIIVRMLSSPVRACLVSHRLLPSGTDLLPFLPRYTHINMLDFLIRLAPMRLPTPLFAREAQSLVPDGLEHPKYKSRRSHNGIYIICWKHALDHLAERGMVSIHGPKYVSTQNLMSFNRLL